MEHLVPTINIKVEGFSVSHSDDFKRVVRRFTGSQSTLNKQQRKPPCVVYNKTKLWFQPSPIGLFMNNKWEPVHCSEPNEEIFETCLRHRHLVLYGDSTSRQWFSDILERFNCSLTTELWTDKKWKKTSAALCPKNNLTMEWVLHSFPGNMHKQRKKATSTAKHMMQRADHKHIIFVIHLLCHVTAYHHSVFRDRISNIRKSVEAVLKGNNNATVLIKGGHTFRDFREVSDYYTYVYRTILIEEFRGLHDKVVYLDNKDITTAKEIRPNHPDKPVVREMVNQMLSYVCGP